jgi:hypothetical protein
LTAKLSKHEADYRVSRSDARRCGRCKFLVFGPIGDDNKCTVVEGKINIDDVCDYFERR